jgi:type III secretion system TyeA family effector delivery regulator
VNPLGNHGGGSSHVGGVPEPNSVSRKLAGSTAGEFPKRPYQVLPATSAIDIATRALHASRGGQSLYTAAHGVKNFQVRHGGQHTDALAVRGLVTRITLRMVQVKNSKLEELLRRFPEADDPDQLMISLRGASLPPAAMALVLARMAQVYRGKIRSRLEKELDELLESGSDWALAMLSWIEFGSISRDMGAQMKALYQRSSLVREGLAKFFEEMMQIADRRRKIKVLIRALGAELSGMEDALPEGARLAATVLDLKRLFIFLGCEEHCAVIASAMRSGIVDGEAILRLLIRMIDQCWLYPDWIQEEAVKFALDSADIFQLARQFLGMAKILPEPCFRDEDQRRQIIEALETYITKYIDSEV